MLGNDALLQRRSQILAYYLTAEKAKTWMWEEFELWRDKDNDLRLRVVAISERTLVSLGAGSKTGRCHHSHPQFRQTPTGQLYIYPVLPSVLLHQCSSILESHIVEAFIRAHTVPPPTFTTHPVRGRLVACCSRST
jgi:hypothetical protein